MSRHFKWITFLLFILPIIGSAQKKPLNSSVYDSWQNTNELSISNDGKFIFYEVNPQEGNGNLYIQNNKGHSLFKIARGFDGVFFSDGKHFVCKIKPTFEQIRQAKIDKKSPEESPHDSLAIVDLISHQVRIYPNIKSFQYSKKKGNLLAFLSEKEKKKTTHLPNDSLSKIKLLQNEIDSLRKNLTTIQTNGFAATKVVDSKKKKSIKEAGTKLTILNLSTNDSLSIPFVMDYDLSEKGEKVLVIEGHDTNDSTFKVEYYTNGLLKNILHQALSIKNPTLNKDGSQAIFIVDKDSTDKALRNFYTVYHYKIEDSTAIPIISKTHHGIYPNWQISEFANLSFSTTSKKIILGTAPILPLKDTSLPEFERVHLDIWNYNEDDLHSSQLYNLVKDVKKSYKAIYDIQNDQLLQLEDSAYNRVFIPEKGDGKFYYAISDSGKRIERQWLGQSHSNYYKIDPINGKKTIISKNLLGIGRPSYTGKYFTTYDETTRLLSIYNSSNNQRKAVSGIKFPIYDEENDVPAAPDMYGIMGWNKNDSVLFVYDRYDIWTVNPIDGKAKKVTEFGRKNKIIVRYENTDPSKEYINISKPILLDLYNESTKNNQFVAFNLKTNKLIDSITPLGNYKVASLKKAKNTDQFIFTKQNYQSSPNVFYTENKKNIVQLSNINQQQAQYNWGTAELYKWTSYTGKLTEGIIYKPENFDPTKKYPMISYFYERNNETLYNYIPPAPTPSRLNISYFVSRGYIVFVPDIWYTTGHPGLSAYNFIVSGIRSILKLGYIDSTKLGIQGQSWGGYQTAYLITKVPNLFAAAWAGAPVVNMFSAYGGIRWESGMNRQFQYEKTQSRIGKTIWEDPKLYIDNSPLFNLPKVKTPVVIMSNDADGAVPWYQGIEMFTDLRRLGKKAWLLNYNGEAHNLMQRKNRKDISIREQQFFDWILKGEKPAPWMVGGVPAVMKDKTMGL